MKRHLVGLTGIHPSYITQYVRISFGLEVGIGKTYYYQQSVSDADNRQTNAPFRGNKWT